MILFLSASIQAFSQTPMPSSTFQMKRDDDTAAAMHEALQNLLFGDANQNNDERALSQPFIEGLLIQSSDDDQLFTSDDGSTNCIRETCDEPLWHRLRGLPRRPFYRELSHRLSTIRQYNADALPFLPASHFGVTELQSTSLPEPPQQITSVDDCTKWLQHVDESTILAFLGMRRTVGTVSKCFSANESDLKATEMHFLFPPSRSQLLASSRQLHKPDTKSSLTVSARALSKHAHRGSDGFFGVVQGSESQKNEHADGVVQNLIREAAWINIHAFGGVDETKPVVEVRTAEGYGARWSARWKKTHSPEDAQFRGFLEPTMDVDMHHDGGTDELLVSSGFEALPLPT